MSTFSDLGLNENILKALAELEFITPTPIQEKAIPRLLESKKDLVALAQTGTGKTAAYSLPVIQQLDANSRDVQAMVLCPTRELCLQITKEIQNFIKHSPGLRVTPIYGGANAYEQIQELRQGVQIVVGTPGRVLDLIERKKLMIDKISWLIIDEADEILDMGFKDDLDAILATTPKEKQTMLFSATMPSAISMIAKKYMKDSEEIRVDKSLKGAVNVEHKYYMVHAKDRYEALRRIADLNPAIYGIIFCRTRAETQEIADKLIQDKYSAEAIHGDLSQQQRTSIMERFRKKQVQLMVATDVAARGIDVDDLTHIINYQLPDSLETYVHRSGRTGRAGKSGTSLSIIHMKEMGKIRILENKIGKAFKREPIPSGSDICEKQLLNLIDKVEKVTVNEDEICDYLPAVFKKLEGMDRETLIKHFVSMEFNHFLGIYKDAVDLNAAVSSNPRERNPGMKFSSFKIDLGKKDGLEVRDLFKLINTEPKAKGVEIGHISILENFSYFEVDASYENAILNCFKYASYRGKPIRIKFEQAPPQSRSRYGRDGAGRPPRPGGFGGGRPEFRGGSRGAPRGRR
ncbi:MAG: DEAD/DEAH box helicase [Patescibacteria group bacterium]